MLLAVLLNPPAATSGVRTRSAVERAGRVLGFDTVELANLCPVATPSVVELNGHDDAGDWSAGRGELARAVGRADALLGGWGVAGLGAAARQQRDAQVTWLFQRARLVHLDGIWMVGGAPRHPSRWHQYVSDRYGRTTGGSFEERLGQVLARVPLEETQAASLSSEAAPVTGWQRNMRRS